MSDASTGQNPAAGIAGVAAGLGLTPVPEIVDGSGLAGLTGPFLTADVVDDSETVIGSVAVIDGPDGGDETLLDRLASVAAVELGGSVVTGQPVADGAGVAARFSVPIVANAFGNGAGVTVLSVTTADRRGQPSASPPGAGLVPGAGAVPGFGHAVGGPESGPGLQKLINVSLDVSVELGRTKVRLADVLDFDVGSVVELDRAAGAPVDVRVNEMLLAQGEVVLIDDEYAVRITAIFDPNKPNGGPVAS